MKEAVQRARDVRIMVSLIITAWILSFMMLTSWWNESRSQDQDETKVRVSRILALEELTEESQVSFQREIHEWKNVLLRQHDPALRQKYLTDFIQIQETTQELLDAAQILAREEQMPELAEFLQISIFHHALYLSYQTALTHLDAHDPLSYRSVDRQVRGLDRPMENSLQKLAGQIAEYASRQIDELDRLRNGENRWWQVWGKYFVGLEVLIILAFMRLIQLAQSTELKGRRAAVIMDSIDDAIIVTDPECRIRFVNRAAEALLEQPQEKLKRQFFQQQVQMTDEHLAPVPDLLLQVIQNRQSASSSTLHLLHTPAGTLIPVESRAAPILTENDQLDGVVTLLHDMTMHQELTRQLQTQSFRFQLVFEQTGIGIAFCEPHSTRILETNQRMAHILGAQTSEQIIGRHLSEFYVDVLNANTPSGHNAFLKGLEHMVLEARGSDIQLLDLTGQQLRWYHQTVAYLHDPDRHIPSQLVFVFWDIDDRIQLQTRLEIQGSRDQLTGLGNRFLFQCAIENALTRGMTSGQDASFCILLIDLDNFKTINDARGHSVGDSLLKEVALRLTQTVRDYDTVARLGGDEFVILLRHGQENTALAVADKLCHTIAQEFLLEGQRIHTSCSIGISTFPDHGLEYDVLLRRADMAMYQAKSLGKNHFALFSEALEREGMEYWQLETELREALERHEFELYFQPKINLDTGTLCGAEALIRWNHPVRGLVSPDMFIPHAERSDLIIRIGNWVIHEVCRLLNQWDLMNIPPVALSFNASPRQLLEPASLIAQIEESLAHFSILPQRLTMEITETALMQERTWETALEVVKRGISISLDDFGTGYSSLSLLQKLPFSSLKIDRSFVRDFIDNPTDDTLVRAVIGLTHDLGMEVVAEGVETQIQATTLARYGCQTGQGYFFSPPIQTTRFLDYLNSPRKPLKTDCLPPFAGPLHPDPVPDE
ncbi:EAL domain-containing protein [Ferrovum sp.]|uniref:EAL domain-containing protein n=1 Tax=Ferrovum sp. TaxID=2609467 RepID=UPI00261173EB|nr:EAL domain-containing protein [Ferrovum sp.]